MTGTRLARMKLPARRFRIDLPGSEAAQGLKFETAEKAQTEDRLRLRRLVKAQATPSPLIDQKSLRQLIHRLEKVDLPPDTLASFGRTRDLRVRVTGALLKLMDTAGAESLRTFTLIPSRWEIPAADLGQTDPRKLLAQLRSTLVRSAAGMADGFLFAVMHGEFEPESQVYRLHVHGVAGGPMVNLIDKLRSRKGYRARKHVDKPVKINQIRHGPKQLSYILKGYWPSKRIGPVGDHAKIKRNRKGTRIPEPYHTQTLLWFDQYDLGDISLLMGCKYNNGGLILTSARASRT